LTSDAYSIDWSDAEGLVVKDLSSQSESPRGGFVVCTFPATHPQRYLSVRGWDEKGDEVELGMISDLTDWPQASQDAIQRTLARRYLLKRILRIHNLRSAHGYLEFDVDTNVGREAFTMRWSQSQAQDFGRCGKIISDTEDNRYIVPDVDSLPKSDRQKFLQHIYW
jgi:hypothetical protein